MNTQTIVIHKVTLYKIIIFYRQQTALDFRVATFGAALRPIFAPPGPRCVAVLLAAVTRRVNYPPRRCMCGCT
jgi:hypothetical protein